MKQSLVLGTANFGESYGISGKEKPTKEEIDAILIWSKGKILELDSAEDYQGSHKIISSRSDGFDITTKIDLNTIIHVRDLRRRIKKISAELSKDKIDRILLRPHPNNFSLTLNSVKEISQLVADKKVGKIGMSIYETAELQYLAERIEPPFTFQVPLNLFNRNFQKFMETYGNSYKNYEFYVRSIFLQGLLLMNPRLVPVSLKEALIPLRSLKEQLSLIGLSTIEATFSFIKTQEWVTGIIMGVSSLEELKQNYQLFTCSRSTRFNILDELPEVSVRIQDPRKW